MKQLPLSAALLAGVCTTASAQSLPSIPAPTHDWGCEVLLCLANPAGPTAAAACVPPIRRLWRHLARGRAFPSCAMASGPNGRSYARPTYTYYDPCPPGTSELPPGQLAQIVAPMGAGAPPASRAGDVTTYTSATSGLAYSGIGSGDGADHLGNDVPVAPKVCVAGFRGMQEVGYGEDRYWVGAYERVYVAPPQASPRVIDVYIDNALWHRVRW